MLHALITTPRVRVGFHCGTSPVSRGIQWETRGDESHASLIVERNFLRAALSATGMRPFIRTLPDAPYVLVESLQAGPLRWLRGDFGGVQCSRGFTPELAAAEHMRVRTCALSTSEERAVVDFACRQLGKGYDYAMVSGFVWRATAESRKASGRWFCSELVYASFCAARVALFHPAVAPWKVSPAQLAWSPLLQDETPAPAEAA